MNKDSTASIFSRRSLLQTSCAGLLTGTLGACSRIFRPDFHGTELEDPAFGKDFSMPDINGQMRHLADFRGKATMIFFGFTQCPDVCPTSLARAIEIKQKLGPEDADKLAVIFVTIDPERDTPEILQSYLQAFDASFIGLRGDAAQTATMAKAFNVYYKKIPTGSSYTMDHTAATFVYDPKGQLRLVFKHEATAADCADDIRNLIKYDAS